MLLGAFSETQMYSAGGQRSKGRGDQRQTYGLRKWVTFRELAADTIHPFEVGDTNIDAISAMLKYTHTKPDKQTMKA